MVIGIYEIVAIVCCIAFAFLVHALVKLMKQTEKTLSEVEKTVIETRERTLKNVEGVTGNLKDLTKDINGKSKKLDPAFDAVEKVGQISTVIKTGVELYKKKKNMK